MKLNDSNIHNVVSLWNKEMRVIDSYNLIQELIIEPKITNTEKFFKTFIHLNLIIGMFQI
jgi:hypothetical protein